MNRKTRFLLGCVSYSVAATVFGVGLWTALVATRQEEARQRAAYVAMSERQEALYALINSDNHGLAILDKDGLVVEWNDALENWSGYSKEELLGRPITVLMDEESAALHVPAFHQRMNGSVRDQQVVKPIECKLYPKGSDTALELLAMVRCVYPDGHPEEPYSIALINPVDVIE